jgi:hypothetical protein
MSHEPATPRPVELASRSVFSLVDGMIVWVAGRAAVAAAERLGEERGLAWSG